MAQNNHTVLLKINSPSQYLLTTHYNYIVLQLSNSTDLDKNSLLYTNMGVFFSAVYNLCNKSTQRQHRDNTAIVLAAPQKI